MKEFQSVSLTFFMLRILKKLDEKFLRTGPLKRLPFHEEQHGQRGRSANTVFLSVISFIEELLRWKVVCIGPLLYFEVAFNRIIRYTIRRFAEDHAIRWTIIRRLMMELEGRTLSTEW